MEDRRLTVQEIADGVGISRDSANTILTKDFGMRRAVEKFVPKLLSPVQQQLRLEVAQHIPECANRDPEFLKTVISNDTETKVQSSQWKHPTSQRPKKSTTGSEQCEGDTDCFFLSIVFNEYAPLGLTVNKEYYQEVLHHLHDSV
jgi:hypothetical protein